MRLKTGAIAAVLAACLASPAHASSSVNTAAADPVPQPPASPILNSIKAELQPAKTAVPPTPAVAAPKVNPAPTPEQLAAIEHDTPAPDGTKPAAAKPRPAPPRKVEAPASAGQSRKSVFVAPHEGT